jgi:hypothetical protein
VILAAAPADGTDQQPTSEEDEEAEDLMEDNEAAGLTVGLPSEEQLPLGRAAPAAAAAAAAQRAAPRRAAQQQQQQQTEQHGVEAAGQEALQAVSIDEDLQGEGDPAWLTICCPKTPDKC